MDAHEARRVEAGFEARDGLLLQMLLALAREGDVVVLSFRVIELGDGNERDTDAVTPVHQANQHLQ